MNRKRRLLVVLGLLAGVLVVPALATALTGPVDVAPGAAFNASEGPTVVVGEDSALDLSVPFPANDTVSLRNANISGSPNSTVGFFPGSSFSSVTFESFDSPLMLSRNDSQLSVAAVGGAPQEMGLATGASFSSTTVGFVASSNASSSEFEIRGFGPDRGSVRIIDVSTGDTLAAAPVTNRTASFSLPAGQRATIGLREGAPTISNLLPSNETIRVGQAVPLRGDIGHPNFPNETVDVTFHRYETGNPVDDPTLGSAELDSAGTASTTWSPEFGPAARWYVRAIDDSGTVIVSEPVSIFVDGPRAELDVTPRNQDILTDDTVSISGGNASVETTIDVDWDTDAFSSVVLNVTDGDQNQQVSRTLSSPGTFSESIEAISESFAAFTVSIETTNGSTLAQTARSLYIPRVEFRDYRGNSLSSGALGGLSVTVTKGNSLLASNESVSGSGFYLSEILTDPERSERTYRIDVSGGSSGFESSSTKLTESWRGLPTQFVYLRNESSRAASDTTTVIFELQDRSGEFPSNESILRLDRRINGSYQQVKSGLFGANDRVTRELETNATYRVFVENRRTGETRSFSRYTARIEEERVPLEIGDIDLLPAPSLSPVVSTSARLDADENEIVWSLRWDDERAVGAETDVRITAAENETIQLFRQTVYGTGNRTVTVPLTQNQSDVNWRVSWNISYEDPESGARITEFRETVVGGLEDLGIPVSDRFLQVAGLLSLVLLAGLFGGSFASIGAVVTVSAAWMLTFIGILAIPPTFLLAASVIAILLRVATVDL